MNFLGNLIWIIVAYLIGSIPTAFLVAKRVRGIDIREHGSGNIGATNVFRTMGKKWGVLVLAADILKGWAVVFILAPTAGAFPEISPAFRQLLFGAAAIAGHTWTPWLKLKGGKGIATAAGVLIGIFPLASLFVLLTWLICFLIWRYVSLASMVASASFPILLFIFYRDMNSFGVIFLTSTLLSALLIYNHRTNIERLRRGEELRVNFKTPKI